MRLHTLLAQPCLARTLVANGVFTLAAWHTLVLPNARQTVQPQAIETECPLAVRRIAALLAGRRLAGASMRINTGSAKQAIAQLAVSMNPLLAAIAANALVILIDAVLAKRLRANAAMGVPIGWLRFTRATTLMKTVAIRAVELPFLPPANLRHRLRTMAVLLTVTVVTPRIAGRAIRLFADFAENRGPSAAAVAQAHMLRLAEPAVQPGADLTGNKFPLPFRMLRVVLADTGMIEVAAKIAPHIAAPVAVEGERILMGVAEAGVVLQAAPAKIFLTAVAPDVCP